jgi:nucleolar MIF4G domain-containing protein 1
VVVVCRDQQEREIIRVIVDCAGQEARYNPFYGLVAGRCCEFDAKHKFTLQVTFWDV